MKSRGAPSAGLCQITPAHQCTLQRKFFHHSSQTAYRPQERGGRDFVLGEVSSLRQNRPRRRPPTVILRGRKRVKDPNKGSLRGTSTEQAEAVNQVLKFRRI